MADIFGPLDATEAPDTALFEGYIPAYGPFAAVEGADTAALDGRIIPFTGRLAGTDQADTASFAGELKIAGTMAAVETTADTAALEGISYLPVATGTFSASEDATPDQALFLYDATLKVGIINATEGQDQAVFWVNFGWDAARKRWLEINRP